MEKIHEDNRLNLTLNEAGSLEFNQIKNMSPLLKTLIDENSEINLAELINQARQWEGVLKGRNDMRKLPFLL